MYAKCIDMVLLKGIIADQEVAHVFNVSYVTLGLLGGCEVNGSLPDLPRSG